MAKQNRISEPARAVGGQARRTSMVVPRGQAPMEELEGALGASTPSELYCPFPLATNPRGEEAQVLSLAWALEQGIVSEGLEVEKLGRARLGMLEANAFPDAPVEVLTLATVWVTLFCTLDDFVESSHLGPLRLSSYLSEVIASFDGASTGADPLCRGFHDFGSKLRSLTDGPLAKRFGGELEDICSAFLWEEINRQHSTHPDYRGYCIMRQTTVGLRPHFLLSELIGPDGRPAEKDALVLRELERIACLAVGWANDIFTYQKELAQGEGHNLVAVLMDSEELPMREALARSRAMHDEEVCRFLRVQARLEGSFELNEAAEHRVRHLRHWIGGHLQWAVNNGRYRPVAA